MVDAVAFACGCTPAALRVSRLGDVQCSETRHLAEVLLIRTLNSPTERLQLPLLVVRITCLYTHLKPPLSGAPHAVVCDHTQAPQQTIMRCHISTCRYI